MKEYKEEKEKWNRRKEEKTFKYLKYLPEVIKADIIEDTTNYILNHPKADGIKTDLMTIALDTDIKVIVETRDPKGYNRAAFGINFMSDLPIKTLLGLYRRDEKFRNKIISDETRYDISLMLNTMSKYLASRKKLGQLKKYFPDLAKEIDSENSLCTEETKFIEIKYHIDFETGTVDFRMKFNDLLEGEIVINCDAYICDFPELIAK